MQTNSSSQDNFDIEEYEKWLTAFAFHRSERRACRKKRLCDCGHWVDGSTKTNDEIYIYTVYRTNDMPRGQIIQHTMCEPCGRGL